MIVPQGILHKIGASMFDPSKNMAKIEHRGQTTVFRKYLKNDQVTANSGRLKVFSMMRATCVLIFVKICQLMLELLPFLTFLAFFYVIISKIFFSETTIQNEMKLGKIVPWGILQKVNAWIFDWSKNMSALTKNRTQGSKCCFLLFFPELQKENEDESYF